MNKKHAQAMRALGRVRPSVSQVKSLASASSNRVEEIDEGYVAGSGSEDSEGEGDVLDEDVDMDAADAASGADEEDQSDEELERNAVQLTKKPRERVMQTDEARAHLRLLFKNEPVVTSLLYGGHGPFARTLNVSNPATPNQSIQAPLASADMFFMDLVPVPPTRFRPAAKMGEIVFENPQNELLSKILTTSYRIVDLTKLSRSARHKPKADEVIGVVMEAAEMTRVYGMLLESLVQLQIDVNSFMDSNKNPTIIRGGKLPPSGVKQTLEKKDGLFRKHMMVSPGLLSLVQSAYLTDRDSCLPITFSRESESTTPPDPSSRPTSTSRRTRSECRPCSRASSRSRSRSRTTTSSR